MDLHNGRAAQRTALRSPYLRVSSAEPVYPLQGVYIPKAVSHNLDHEARHIAFEEQASASTFDFCSPEKHLAKPTLHLDDTGSSTGLDVGGKDLEGNTPLLLPPKTKQWKWAKIRSRTGWRFGVWYGLLSSSVVLIVNLALIGLGSRGIGYHGGIGVLAEGTSEDMSVVSTVYHVLINIMSTSLLASSNYCMQVLSSPSREAIDAAHEKGEHLELGVWSWKNMKYQSGKKRLLWVLLGLTSVPLHLLYVILLSGVICARSNIVAATIPPSQRSQEDATTWFTSCIPLSTLR